jgi:myosin-crossreactive antigen
MEIPRTATTCQAQSSTRIRCAFDLLSSIPTAADPTVSVKDQFFTFNNANPYDDRAHILDRDSAIVHGHHFGLTLSDGLALSRVSRDTLLKLSPSYAGLGTRSPTPVKFS